MRFAIGSVPQLEQFMSGINMGGLAQGGTDLRSKEKSTGIELQGKVGGAGLRAKGEAISGALLGDARAAAGRSQMMGQIFQTLGQVGGSAMAYGNFGGGANSSTIPPTTMPDAAVQTGSGLNIGGVDQGIHGGITDRGIVYLNS